MQTDDILSTSKLDATEWATEDRIDFNALFESGIPAVVIGPGPLDILVTICADGSCLMTETGRVSNEFAGLRLPTGNLLERACAAEAVLDLVANKLVDKNHGMPMAASCTGRATLCGLTRGAREKLSSNPSESLEDIRERLVAAGHDGSDIFAALKAHGEALEDPLFIPGDNVSWADKDLEDLRPVFRDALLLHPHLVEGPVFLRAAYDGDPGTAFTEDETDLSDPVVDILQEVLDFGTRFTGESFEYNDGAAGRESGYCPEAPEILSVEIDHLPSLHEKLAAWQRLHAALGSAGVPADYIAELIGGTPPTKPGAS